MGNLQFTPSGPVATEPSTAFAEAPGVDAAFRHVEEHVGRVWEVLTSTSVGAQTLFELAIRLATPIVPCVVAPRPLSARDLIRDLRTALANYHPEEIRVVGYTLFSSVVELAYEKCGKRVGRRVEAILDADITTH